MAGWAGVGDATFFAPFVISTLVVRRRLLDADWYYGWVVAFAGFAGATVLFGLSYSFGVFLDPLLGAFDVGSGTVALMFGVQTFVVYTGSVPAGTVVDTIGARRSALLSTVLVSGGLIGASTATSFPVLLGWYGIVTGLGMGLLYVVAYTAVPRWFGRHRGLAMGLASSGLGIGILVVAPLAAWLIERVGWRGAYAWLGIGSGAVLAVATYLLDDSPQAIGADPGREFPGGQPPERQKTSLLLQLRAVAGVARTGPFVSLFVGWAFIWTPLYILMNHVVRFVTVSPLPAGLGVTAISVIGLSTSVARVGVGSASDRLGRVRTFVASGTLVSLTVPAIALSDGRFAFLALTVLFGVGYGGGGALLSPLVAELFGGENLGTTFGLASVAFALSGLLAPSLAGYLYEAIGRYEPIFLGAGAIGLLGALLVRTAGSRPHAGDYRSSR
ncbi:MAG: MFS transporter [Halanaeroarchaeum sp.]